MSIEAMLTSYTYKAVGQFSVTGKLTPIRTHRKLRIAKKWAWKYGFVDEAGHYFYPQMIYPFWDEAEWWSMWYRVFKELDRRHK